jgi:Domain of unknown function (DUF1848)
VHAPAGRRTVPGGQPVWFWTRNIRSRLPERESGNRPGCRCALSRDIGAYDACPHGCVYCYAVADRDRAVANYRDPEAETLRR